MSIRTRQLEVESEKLLRKELLEGNYPSLTAVNQKVAERFQTRPAGLPRLKPQTVAVRQVSSAEAYNEMVESVHEDLDVSYQELTFQGDRMMALANYYDTEKARIQLQLKRLNQRTEILQERLASRGQRTVFFDTFNDYLTLEMNGDKGRNIERTDAFVDLRYGYATLDRFGKGIAKQDLSSVYPKVTPVTKFTETLQLSAIEGALSDMINEGWGYKAVMEEAGEAVITLSLEFTTPVTTNLVSMLPQSPRATFVTLRTSLDGVTYTDELEKSVNTLTEWNFSEREIKFIEFKLRKAEPDVVSGTNYEFYFGAENISVRNLAFLPQGYVVSEPHHIQRSFDNVTLVADEVIPPDTEIKYFLGIDKMDGSIVEWQPIENGKTVNMNAFITENVLVTPAAAGYGALYGSRYGQNYYRIANLSHVPVPRSMQVFVGDKMFKLDKFVQAQAAEYEPTIDTWKRARGFETKYVSLSDLANGNFLDTTAGENIRLTAYVTFAEAKGFNMDAMVLYNAKGAVYLNNSSIQKVGSGYWLNFKAGVNKLEILYYADTDGQVDVNVTANELEDIGATSIYAQEKTLQQVSVYDLMNNTSKRDLSKFAISEANEVVLNYNPAAVDVKGVGVSYRLSYQYNSGLIDDDNYLRFMATLVRNVANQDLTPVLRSYKLIIE